MAEKIPLEIRILEMEEIWEPAEGDPGDAVRELFYKTGVPEYCRGIAAVTGNTALVSEMKKQMPKYLYNNVCTVGKYLAKVLEESGDRYQHIYDSLILPFADLWQKMRFEWNWEALEDEDETPFD